jgi:Amt family ammonium transporter
MGLASGALALGLMALPAAAGDLELANKAAAFKGDVAFMMSSTILVLLMTIPGLALFYGGLVRTKNMLSMMMQVFTCVCLVCILWVVYGYSIAFSSGVGTWGPFLGQFFGGLDRLFLGGLPEGVTPASAAAATFSNGVYIPELVFICFQMMFAAITPALIFGAVAERMKFSAILAFVTLWVTFAYFPMAHMVWFWGGPDTFADAAKKLAEAGGLEKAPKDVVDAYNAVVGDAGYLFNVGAYDFAGGTVVHINAGIAGLVAAIVAGKRVGYGREAMPPHSLTMSMIGAALLWVGWFGFNCGSNLEANGIAALAMANTFLATASAGLSWMLAEWLIKGKPSLLGLISGVVAGLVAVTPACGFAGIMGSIVLGLIAGIVCFFAATGLKHALGYDDSLDVFGVHCVGGIIGAIGTGILISGAYGGQDIPNYLSSPGTLVADPTDVASQVWKQTWAVGTALVWSTVVSLVSLLLIKVTIGLRHETDKEREGLDISDHGERAYNY